jgi:predicted enzyme related to lactoylglutathione lyase
MRLATVTVLQRKVKHQLAQYFYSQILGLPHQQDINSMLSRWFTHPAMLEAQAVDPTALQQPHGGLTGIQLNVFPMGRVHSIVNDVRKIGYKVPNARRTDDMLVASVQDPTGNAIMVVGHRERPAEALTNQAIGSVSVFVSSLARIRGFYENVMGLPFVAAPHPGMLVFGEPGGTAIMLYQTARGNPETPVGRLTPYTFSTDDLPAAIAAIERSEGTIVNRVTNAETGEIERIVFKDPDRNTFTVADEASLNLPEPLPVEEIIVEAPPEVMDRGASLELDDEPAHIRELELDDVPTFDRDLEFD